MIRYESNCPLELDDQTKFQDVKRFKKTRDKLFFDDSIFSPFQNPNSTNLWHLQFPRTTVTHISFLIPSARMRQIFHGSTIPCVSHSSQRSWFQHRAPLDSRTSVSGDARVYYGFGFEVVHCLRESAIRIYEFMMNTSL